MPSMPSLEDVAAIMAADSEQSLMDVIRRSATALGFDHFMLGIEVARPLLKPVQHVSSGYPPGWRRTYAENEYARKDPTVSHCKAQATPLLWSETMYTAQSRDLWEDARAHGIGFGMSVPVHDFAGSKSMFSLARDRPLDQDPQVIEHIRACAQVIASCAHFVMNRLFVPALLSKVDPRLTAREQECLGWTAKGKTAAEVGMILNISEATAVFHLNNVVRKLNVANKTQAVAMAVAMGLVS
jgi:DNA-binding CsgD family transcriptional regulator